MSKSATGNDLSRLLDELVMLSEQYWIAMNSKAPLEVRKEIRLKIKALQAQIKADNSEISGDTKSQDKE